MDKVTIEIDTVNSAFKEDDEAETEGQEIARILRKFADEIEDRYYPEKLRDINGNTVGKVMYE